MNKGLFILGLIMILSIVFLKYFFVPMIVDNIRSQVSQYTGSTIASYLVTSDNLVKFCNAINSKIGIFGITIQDIMKIVSPDTVNKCNQFLLLMQIIGYEYIFYIVGFVLIVAGLAIGRKKVVVHEVVKERKHEEIEEKPEEVEKKPTTKKASKKTKFCSECGNKLNPSDKFCGRCGAEI